MNRRIFDRILIFLMIGAAVFFLTVVLHSKAEAEIGDTVRRMIAATDVFAEPKTERIPKVCDFGGCPVAKPEPTEPETAPEPETEALIFAETAEESVAYEPVYAPEQNDISGTWLGVFKCTAYCGCDDCSEGWGSMTATGAYARAYHTIAVDPSVLPYGTRVSINGVVYTAEDCGGGVNGKHIDIYFDNHWECEAFGVRWLDVYRV